MANITFAERRHREWMRHTYKLPNRINRRRNTRRTLFGWNKTRNQNYKKLTCKMLWWVQRGATEKIAQRTRSHRIRDSHFDGNLVEAVWEGEGLILAKNARNSVWMNPAHGPQADCGKRWANKNVPHRLRANRKFLYCRARGAEVVRPNISFVLFFDFFGLEFSCWIHSCAEVKTNKISI